MAPTYNSDCRTVPKRPSRERRATNGRLYRYQRGIPQDLCALRSSAYTSSEAEDDIPPPPPVPQSSPTSPEGSFITGECYIECIQDGLIEPLPSPASPAPTSSSSSSEDHFLAEAPCAKRAFCATPQPPHLSTFSFKEWSPVRLQLPYNGNGIMRENPTALISSAYRRNGIACETPSEPPSSSTIARSSFPTDNVARYTRDGQVDATSHTRQYQRAGLQKCAGTVADSEVTIDVPFNEAELEDNRHRKTLPTRIGIRDWFPIWREDPLSCCPSWVIFTSFLLLSAVVVWLIVRKCVYGE